MTGRDKERHTHREREKETDRETNRDRKTERGGYGLERWVWSGMHGHDPLSGKALKTYLKC